MPVDPQIETGSVVLDLGNDFAVVLSQPDTGVIDHVRYAEALNI